MLSDLLMLRVACRVVEGQGEDSSHTKPRIILPPSSMSAGSSFPIWTSSTNTNAMRTLPRLHPQLANMPLPAINISTATMTHMDGSTTRDGRRIAPLQLRTPPTATVATHAADLMLGLKRLAQRDNDDEQHHDSRPQKRARGQSQPASEATIKSETNTPKMPAPPGVFMSSPLAALVSAQRPTLLPSIRSPIEASKASLEATREADASQRLAAPVTLVSFLGKRSHDHRGSSANATVPAQATSPTSVWEDAHSDSCSSSDGDQLSPVQSPQALLHIHAMRPQISTLRVPTHHQWRAPTIPQGMAPRIASSHSPPLAPARPPSSLPTLPEAALPRQAAAPSQSTPMPTTRPTLVRKSSSQWRQEIPTQDREKTRERIQRGLHNVCRSDYEAMLAIVCSMEEELLHLHTTSKDHYFLQTLALRDRIHSLRTGAHAHSSPRQQSSQ